MFMNLLSRRFSAPLKRAQLEPSYLEQYWPSAVDWYEHYFSKFTLKMYRTAIPFLHLDTSHRIIELGGGLGFGAEILLPHVPVSASYTLTNHVEILVELCKKRNLARTDSIKVDPANLPFGKEHFDRFVAMATFEELANASQVIKEAYRVLTPGGILVASISGKKEVHSLGMIFNKIRDLHGINHPINFKQNLGNVGSVKRIFKDAGFSRVFAFYESVQYQSMDINNVKNVFLQEPVIKKAINAENHIAIEKSIEKELKKLFNVEQIPLSAEFLLIVATKPK